MLELMLGYKQSKMTELLIAIFFSIIMVIKWVEAKIVYPIAYYFKDWVYGDDVIQNYHMPSKAKENWIAWFLWLHLDDDQPTGFPMLYGQEILGYTPITKWDNFRCAYAWSAWRNPAYNINYCYFGNRSEIVVFKKLFGKYEWNRKLRASNGDSGVQLVMFTTEKYQQRFLFSLAYNGLFPMTIYFGWNTNTNGRFTVAWKFK